MGFVNVIKNLWKDILIGILLIVFCGVIVVLGIGAWNAPYWLLGVFIGVSIFVLSLKESTWKIQDWYTFVISAVTISLVIVISYWVGVVFNFEKDVPSNVGNIITGLSAMATVLMVFYVAIQTHATKQSLDELKKQRLTPIVVNTIGVLRLLKYKLETNFELIRYGTSNPDYPENLLEIKDELEKPELLLVDSLLELDLYRELKVYQKDLENLKKYSAEIRRLMGVIGEEKLIETLKEVQKEIGVEINKMKGNGVVIGDGSVFLPEANGNIYATILGLAREAAERHEDAKKLYESFRERLQHSDEENMKRLGGWYLQELYSAMLGLVLTPDEEDVKQGIPRDKRVKKIEIAIERLMNEYIK